MLMLIAVLYFAVLYADVNAYATLSGYSKPIVRLVSPALAHFPKFLWQRHAAWTGGLFIREPLNSMSPSCIRLDHDEAQRTTAPFSVLTVHFPPPFTTKSPFLSLSPSNSLLPASKPTTKSSLV